MPRKRSRVQSGLRLKDLAAGPRGQEKLLSVRLPILLLDRLDDACRRLDARKGEIVVAMLNEGLARYARMGLPSGR